MLGKALRETKGFLGFWMPRIMLLAGSLRAQGLKRVSCRQLCSTSRALGSMSWLPAMLWAWAST